MFDSLKYAKILEESGLSRNQAETHIRVLNDLLENGMATKQDLNIVKNDLRTLTKTVAAELRSEMNSVEHRIVYKLGGLIVACLTLGIASVQMIGN